MYIILIVDVKLQYFLTQILLEVVVSYNCFTFLLCFRSILTFFDAKIEAVPDFAIFRFVKYFLPGTY